MIHGITVCVDYSEYLQLTLGNREFFDKWTVVTVEQDEKTISLCEKENIDYVFSERIKEGGPFCKGKAINDAILKREPKGWVCLVDADCYLFAETLKNAVDEIGLDEDNLYGLLGRLLVADEKELNDLLNSKRVITTDNLQDLGILVGFFQMWHRSIRPFYPEESKHAGLDDVLMRESYEADKRKLISAYAIHIGKLWINHKGRVE